MSDDVAMARTVRNLEGSLPCGLRSQFILRRSSQTRNMFNEGELGVGMLRRRDLLRLDKASHQAFKDPFYPEPSDFQVHRIGGIPRLLTLTTQSCKGAHHWCSFRMDTVTQAQGIETIDPRPE